MHERRERPSWPRHRKEQSPYHNRDEGQKVSLTPQILQVFSDGQEPQLHTSTPNIIFNASSNASRNTSVSSTSRLNQYHGGDAVTSASASWHRAAAAYTTKDDRNSASSNASRSASVSSTSRLNQYHGGDAVTSASASWHRAAAGYTTKDDRNSASSNASGSTSVSSTSQLNQYHSGDAVTSASASWHRAAAAYTTKDARKLPMVMCSPPAMLDGGHYVIRLLVRLSDSNLVLHSTL